MNERTNERHRSSLSCPHRGLRTSELPPAARAICSQLCYQEKRAIRLRHTPRFTEEATEVPSQWLYSAPRTDPALGQALDVYQLCELTYSLSVCLHLPRHKTEAQSSSLHRQPRPRSLVLEPTLLTPPFSGLPKAHGSPGSLPLFLPPNRPLFQLLLSYQHLTHRHFYAFIHSFIHSFNRERWVRPPTCQSLL